MRKNNIHKLLATVILLFLIHNCDERQQFDTEKASQVQKQIETSLKRNILEKWYPRIIDRENGGFHAKYDRQWNRISSYPKALIFQSRGVWTASKAAMRYPQENVYEEAANHGFRFLKNQAWDAKYGGFYQSIPSENQQIWNKSKTAYGNSFAIYALAAYHDLTGSEEALELAKKTFYWLEKHCYDSTYGGYFNYATRKGITYKEKDKFIKQVSRLSKWPTKSRKYKDYNTTIHLMEAFSELYRVWPNELMKKRLQEVFDLICNKIYSEKGYLKMFFNEQWEHISFKDSSKTFLMAHSWYDHVSFGHDMETAFLLLEAEDALKKENTNKTLTIAKNLVDHSVAHGFDKDYAGVFYEGYYFTDDSITIINSDKEWWPQAEALNALLMFAILYPGNKQYQEAFYSLWDYTSKYIVDNKYGGWYKRGLDQERKENLKLLKASPWKSCYHNYRALSNCADMLRHGSPIMEIE